MKKTEIQIDRQPVERKPVAYYNTRFGAVYFPGEQGKCITSVGITLSCNYANINFDSMPSYEPLYKGDVIRIVSTEEIIL